MAVGMHFVNVGMVQVDANGTRVDKTTTTIKGMLIGGTEHRVLPEADVPNSIGYPAIKSYVVLEAASGYVVYHMDQYIIITYKSTDLNL